MRDELSGREEAECIPGFERNYLRKNWTKDSGISRTNMKVKGAKAFIEVSHKRFNRYKKLTQASYFFTKSFWNEAGKFNKQHGGLELPGGRGMIMLSDDSRTRRIKEIIIKAYEQTGSRSNGLMRQSQRVSFVQNGRNNEKSTESQ